MTHGTHPPKQGLYDPRYEHDSCGVGFVVDLKSRKSHTHRRAGAADPGQPGAPRRLRLREGHRRRRRHPRADAARLPGARCASGPDSVCRNRAITPSAASSCRPTTRIALARARRSSSRSCARRARPSSAGATCRSSRAAARPDRAEGMPAIRQIFIGRGSRAPGSRRRPGLRAEALRHPPPRRERRAQLRRCGKRGHVLHPFALLQDADLQGDAQRRPAGAVLPRPARPGPRHRPGPGALALQHQHLPQLGRAHPYRYMAHNGEINTLRGNVNWMTRPREPVPLRAVRRRT